MVIMSAERIVAILKPVLYKYYFNFKTKILLVLVIVIVQIAILIWAGLSAIDNYQMTSTQHCAIISSTGKAFATFHFVFDVFGYFISFISLSILYVYEKIHNKNSNKQGGSHKIEQHILIYMIISLFDVILCAMPSVVMIGSLWQLFIPGDILVSLTYATTGLMSLVHTIMNYIFFSDYQKQVKLIVNYMIRGHWFSIKTRVSNIHVQAR
uniref:G-protein coupled receptors family 1 profile domain-containing protein n=1 Tax=Acrobeloides nanus TaxID=290746 RepID=A0A914C1L3_9BILA